MYISQIEWDIIKCFQQLKRYFNEDEVFILLKFMFEITDKWFEYYIKDYFKKEYKYDRIKVIWWMDDGWIDIIWKYKNKHTLIQCKQYRTSHVRHQDLLKFVADTEKYKKRIWEVLSLYFITTSRVNKDAYGCWNHNNIEIKDCHDILKMNKEVNIDDFINKYKKNKEITNSIDTKDIINRLYSKKLLGLIPYYILKILNKISKIFNLEYELDFEKIDRKLPKQEITIKKSINY